MLACSTVRYIAIAGLLVVKWHLNFDVVSKIVQIFQRRGSPVLAPRGHMAGCPVDTPQNVNPRFIRKNVCKTLNTRNLS